MTGPVNFFEAPSAVADDRECPACGEVISRKARSCPHCRADIAALEKTVRPPLPRSVRALAILYFFIAFLMGIGIIFTIGIAANNPVGRWLPLISVGPITIMLIALGASYLRGHWWAWWFTIANSTMVSIIYPIGFLVRLIRAQAMSAELGMMLVFAAIALLIHNTFRSANIQGFFQVKDAGILKTVLAMLIVFLGQVLLVSGPAIALVFLVGPQQLLGR